MSAQQQDAGRWERARAKGEALVARVERVARDKFLVPSQTEEGHFWEVFVVGAPGAVVCTCPAGANGAPCAHAASIYLWIKAHNARCEAKRATPIRRCQACHLGGVTLFESPSRRLLCGQCAEGEQREAGARRRRAA